MEEVQEAVGNKLATTYIRRRQGTVGQCVALRIILKICARETVYEGGKRKRETWGRQEAPETQLKKILGGILQEVRRR